MFDGIFVDDSGAGTWLPMIMKNGKDVLFTTEAEKAAMVPQLEMRAPDVQPDLADQYRARGHQQLFGEQADQRPDDA